VENVGNKIDNDMALSTTDMGISTTDMGISTTDMGMSIFSTHAI
jgi:hypothetical protein